MFPFDNLLLQWSFPAANEVGSGLIGLLLGTVYGLVVRFHSRLHRVQHELVDELGVFLDAPDEAEGLGLVDGLEGAVEDGFAESGGEGKGQCVGGLGSVFEGGEEVWLEDGAWGLSPRLAFCTSESFRGSFHFSYRIETFLCQIFQRKQTTELASFMLKWRQIDPYHRTMHLSIFLHITVYSPSFKGSSAIPQSVHSNNLSQHLIWLLIPITIIMSKEHQNASKQKLSSSDNLDANHLTTKSDPKALLNENKFIRKQNEILRKQLENISIRLDGEIKKRLQEQKKKPSGKLEDISQMELQNAYKKCQIYKKEVSFYKKKLESIPDVDRFEEFEKKIAECVKENQQLKEELKHVKKINKLQEKGLAEIGAEGFLKMTSENEKLHDEVRILKKQIDDERRGKARLTKQKTETENFNSSKIQSSKITDKDIKFQQDIKKRIRTQSNNTGTEEDLSDVLHQKVEKDYVKIKALMGEKGRLRDMVDNLKMQLSQKDKQIANLRDKVASLRKNNQVLQNQVNSRMDNHPIAEELENQSKMNRIKKSKTRLEDSRRRVWKKPVSDGEGDQLDSSQLVGRYPRMQERGSKMENTIKWSHQALSSKIKQIQVLLHESGHIKDLHVKYQKGEPKKYDGGKGKYAVLTCGDEEFIKFIKGCFYDDYLQYLTVITSRKRVQKFGKWQEFERSDEGESFEFEVGEGEFPGALFGENDQVGVRRLGCFIHKQG